MGPMSDAPDEPAMHRMDALDEAGLCRLARTLGAVLQLGDAVLLQGPMGAGKTTLTRALAEGLGVARPDRVRSPTFNVCLRHEGPRPLLHVDLFRLADAPGAASFESLGLDEAGPDGVLVVEWAELWGDPPADHLWLALTVADDPARRRVEATARGVRARALLRQLVTRLALEAGEPPAGADESPESGA